MRGQSRPKKDIRDVMEAVIKVDLTKSMLSMARGLMVSFSTTKDMVKTLGLECYFCWHLQLLSEASKKSRLDRSKKLIT